MFVRFKFLKLLSFLLILTFFPINKSFSGANGNGELKLSSDLVYYFIQYIRGGQHKYPMVFYVTEDGTDGTYWYCPEMSNCREDSPSQSLQICLRQTGQECKRFARKRTIIWKNDINPGKGKMSKINSKWSDQEIIDKLVKLGFYSK